MKRIRIAGLCLVAVFAFSAIVTGSASAAAPEYKTCIKAVPKNTGNFSDKNCSVAAPGTGKYELGEWNQGKKLTFKGKNGESTLDSYVPEVEAEFWKGGTVVGTVTCKSAKSRGEITGPKTSTVTVEFKSCASEGKKCTSVSPAGKPGSIVTKPLTSILGLIGPEAVGSLVEAGNEGLNKSAEFNCEGLEISTTGSVIGVNSGNTGKFGKEGTQTFAVNGKGGQEVPFGGFPNESEGVWGPGTGAVHVLKTFANPPGVNIPSGESTTSVLKGENMEITVE
jgi:hypothetical protein